MLTSLIFDRVKKEMMMRYNIRIGTSTKQRKQFQLETAQV